LWVPASENWRDIQAAGLGQRVFPIHADARSLPFAAEFFDAIVALDCYSYFGTDDLYLNYLTQFVKPEGPIGIAGAGLVEEMPVPVPDHLLAALERRADGYVLGSKYGGSSCRYYKTGAGQRGGGGQP